MSEVKGSEKSSDVACFIKGRGSQLTSSSSVPRQQKRTETHTQHSAATNSKSKDPIYKKISHSSFPRASEQPHLALRNFFHRVFRWTQNLPRVKLFRRVSQDLSNGGCERQPKVRIDVNLRDAQRNSLLQFFFGDASRSAERGTILGGFLNNPLRNTRSPMQHKRYADFLADDP